MDKNICCVYFHRRKKDNTVFYVGMGSNYRPYSAHHRNRYWKHIVKSDDGFIVDIRFDGISRELAYHFEKKYISFFGRVNYDKNGILVNCGIGGEGSSGFKVSEEVKERISNTLKKKFEDKEFKEEFIRKRSGWKHSEETKLKMSLNTGARSEKEIQRKRELLLNGLHPFSQNKGERHPFFGKKQSDSAKEKIGNANRGRIAVNKKPIMKYSLDGVLIKEYDSINQASLDNKCSNSSISQACSGKKTLKGFVWKYK